jgi:hypothetical protein
MHSAIAPAAARLLSFAARAACGPLLCGLLVAATGQATPVPHATHIAVPYGLTRVPLTQDGVRALLVRARRDDVDHHGFDVLSIYALLPGNGDGAPFLLVSVWDKDKERLEVTSGGGAGCTLHGFRLLGGAGQDLQLLLAQRDFGRSYADEAEVTFTRYALKRGTSRSSPGHPAYYFESGESFKARNRYCDIDRAFGQELGL